MGTPSGVLSFTGDYMNHAPFLRDPETEQIYEWTEKLASIAYQRGLVPHHPAGMKKPVECMIKVELEVEANKSGVKLDRRKSVDTLREEVQALRDKE